MQNPRSVLLSLIAPARLFTQMVLHSSLLMTSVRRMAFLFILLASSLQLQAQTTHQCGTDEYHAGLAGFEDRRARTDDAMSSLGPVSPAVAVSMI